MAEHRKYGWTEKGFIGMIFGPIGLFFLIMGILFWHFQVGQKPGDPQVFLFVFGGMGAAFFLAGLILLLCDLRRRAALRRAYEGGYAVMATIAGVQARKNVNMNGSCPHVVECHYTDPDTGVVHVYFSRYLYFNVEDLLQSDKVPVYIDRMHDEIGFVDIDAVLPPIRIHRP